MLRQTIVQTNYDSVLHTARPGQEAQLIIRLKVVLLPYDPTQPQPKFAQMPQQASVRRPGGQVRHGTVRDGDGKPFAVRDWLDAEFNAFVIKFKRVVERSWNDQLILLPPDGSDPSEFISDEVYRQLISSPTVPAHVVCKLDIEIADVAKPGRTPHVIMSAIRLENPTDGLFGSSAFMITNEDTDIRSNGFGITGSVTAAHEIGHWLGRPVASTDPKRYFPHVDPDYGRTKSKRMAIMGKGPLVTSYEATPFLDRVRRHTGVLFGWDIVHRIHFNNGRIPVSPRQKQLVS